MEGRLLQQWLPPGLGGAELQPSAHTPGLFTTSHPYLREAVVRFLPLPSLSPTHCLLMCVFVFLISHGAPRARHGAHSQTTQSVTTSQCAKDRKSDLQNSEGTLGSFSSKCLVFSSAGQTKGNKGNFHFSSLSHLLSRSRMISSTEDMSIIHWLYQIQLEWKLDAWYWVRDKWWEEKHYATNHVTK